MTVPIRFIMATCGLLGLGLMSACGPSVDGFYTGHRDLAGPKHIADTAGRVELTLKPGNNFELLQYSLPIQGSYEFRDDKIYLKAKSSLGHAVAGAGEGIYLVRIKDGWELHDPLGPLPDPVPLTRTAEPPSPSR